MIELLAPAGDIEKLKVALHYSADAIYFGGQNYSLRANAKNFSLEEIKEATMLAHSLNKKVYVAVNIIFHDEDFKGLKEYLLYLDEIGIDAIMVSDIAVLELCNELKLKIDRYVSTQASVLNEEAAMFYKELGVKRIVLAREAMKEDVIAIKSRTGLDLEAFVHGAMCTGFSGRCILSNYLTNRDSNRGGCAQICRWKFDFYDENNDLISDNFWLSCKDLSMVDYFKEMFEAGIYSFKIEGRMRSIYYIATVLHCYRLLFNKLSNNSLNPAYINFIRNILNRCANRENATQFFNKFPDENEQYYLGSREEVSNQDFLGIVLENKDNIITIEQRNYFKIGDEVQFFGPQNEFINYKIDNLYDENLNKIEIANHPQMIIKIKAKLPVSPGDMLRIKIFDI
ncbi:MAG: U32 family peptidase [Mollicutes bacterium]|nr:U32 family peptidase [Mollicutes bacterium]